MLFGKFINILCGRLESKSSSGDVLAETISASGNGTDKLNAFNAELSETKAGYIYVSGTSDREHRSDMRSKKARDADAASLLMSALQHLLSDPQYAEAYSKAKDTISDFKQRMTDRLAQLEQEIETLDDQLEAHAPGSTTHRRLMREREELQRRQQELLDYYNDTVQPIENKLDDPDNPLSRDELDRFNDKVQEDMKSVFETLSVSSQPENPVQSKTANIEIPKL